MNAGFGKEGEDMKEAQGTVLGHTQSLCPVCLQRIAACRVAYGEDVYLEKQCAEHGLFRTVIWRGDKPSYSEWSAVKFPSAPVSDQPARQGCPYDCGLCPEHRQQTCCVLLEVTGRCNLLCPVCFAQSGEAGPDPGLPEIESWYQKLLKQGGPFNIQLSGGEPTVRDDLPEIVAIGKRLGFSFFQLNTNGLRLAADADYAERLKAAGLSCVFLQFDGTNDAIYQTLRGQALLREKLQVLEHCESLALGVILVVTVVPGVNDGNIGDIIRLAIDRIPTVRGVHFQPVSYFGRYPAAPADEDRITLPEIIRAIEQQSGGRVSAASLRPPRAENAYCSFQGNYVLMPDGELRSWATEQASCCGAATTDGSQRAREFVAKKWTVPATRQTGASGDCCCGVDTRSLDEFLDRVERFSFCLSGMAFQDAWTVDLERLRECFIHVVTSDERIVPFCAYNLTDINGRSMYRPSAERDR